MFKLQILLHEHLGEVYGAENYKAGETLHVGLHGTNLCVKPPLHDSPLLAAPQQTPDDPSGVHLREERGG